MGVMVLVGALVFAFVKWKFIYLFFISKGYRVQPRRVPEELARQELSSGPNFFFLVLVLKIEMNDARFTGTRMSVGKFTVKHQGEREHPPGLKKRREIETKASNLEMMLWQLWGLGQHGNDRLGPSDSRIVVATESPPALELQRALIFCVKMNEKTFHFLAQRCWASPWTKEMELGVQAGQGN